MENVRSLTSVCMCIILWRDVRVESITWCFNGCQQNRLLAALGGGYRHQQPYSRVVFISSAILYRRTARKDVKCRAYCLAIYIYNIIYNILYMYYVLVVIILLLLLLSSSGSRAYDDISNFISTYQLPIAEQKVFGVHAILIHTAQTSLIIIIIIIIIIIYNTYATILLWCTYSRCLVKNIVHYMWSRCRYDCVVL